MFEKGAISVINAMADELKPEVNILVNEQVSNIDQTDKENVFVSTVGGRNGNRNFGVMSGRKNIGSLGICHIIHIEENVFLYNITIHFHEFIFHKSIFHFCLKGKSSNAGELLSVFHLNTKAKSLGHQASVQENYQPLIQSDIPGLFV